MTLRLQSLIAVLSCLLGVAATARAQWQANGVRVSPSIAAGGGGAFTAVIDGFGGAILFWGDGQAGADQIFAQRLDAAGVPQWAPNGVLISSGIRSGYPAAIYDGAGGAIVAWLREYGASPAASDVYAQRIDHSGAIQWVAGGVPVCQASGGQNSISMVSDFRSTTVAPGPGAILTWSDYRTVGGEVFAQAVAPDGVMRWATNGIQVSSTGTSPVIVTDGTGVGFGPKGAIISWTDDRGSTSDIYAQRLGPSGAALWGVGGMPVCTQPLHQFFPSASFISPRGAFVAWVDQRDDGGASTNIYAQRIGDGGTWAMDGLPICRAANVQNHPVVLNDGIGGAIMFWEDQRGSVPDIYAQRVNGTGTPLWGTDGVPVCAEIGVQGGSVLVSDNAAGVIVAWQDMRSDTTIPVTDSDLYVQRVDSAGVSRWGTNGLPVCTVEGYQGNPAIVPDGSGGAIVAWIDRRGGAYAIYAQHVTSTGGIVGVDEEIRPGRFRILAPSPNPALGPMTLRFDLPTARRVTAQVLSVDGRLVRTLIDGAELGAGVHRVVWNRDDSSLRGVPSGVYFLRVNAGDESGVRRIIALR